MDRIEKKEPEMVDYDKLSKSNSDPELAGSEPEEDGPMDLFSPLPPLKGVPEERMPLTGRALVIGILLGSLVNCSNVYLGMLSHSHDDIELAANRVRQVSKLALPLALPC